MISTIQNNVTLLLFSSVAFVFSIVAAAALCVCTKFRKKLSRDGEGVLGERLSNHQVACQVSGDETILPVYGQSSDAVDGGLARRRDGGGGGAGSGRGFLGISSSSRRKSRNSTIDRALPEIPAGFAGINNPVGSDPTTGSGHTDGNGGGRGAGGGGVVNVNGSAENSSVVGVESDPNYDLILGNEKTDSERSGSAAPNTLPPSRDPIYSSVRGEDSSISEGMYAKVQEPRPNGISSSSAAGSARPGAMAMEVNGRPAGIREHEYSRIRNVDEENLYFKVGSDSGSESGYARVHAREASLKRSGANNNNNGGGRISTLALEHGVVVAGDDMYAEIRKTSNPDSGDTDVGNSSFGAFDPTTMENLYAFPPPVPEKQFDLNDSYDPELLQTVQSIPYIDEAGFASPTSPDLPPRNSVGGFSLATGGATTPPPTCGALSLFSQASSLSSINNNSANNGSGHNKTPSLASATSSSSTIVNASGTVGSSSVGAPSIRGEDNGGLPLFPADVLNPPLHSLPPPHTLPHPHQPFAIGPDGAALHPPQSAGPDDKKDYVIITARESVPVLQARRAHEAAAKELAEKKRRHVYQNVNGGGGGAASSSQMDDSSDSENYAKVIDPVASAQPPSGVPQRHSTPALSLTSPKPSSTAATNGWIRREHTYSTVDGDDQLYSEVPEASFENGGGLDANGRRIVREPIDPPPPPEVFHALLNKSPTDWQQQRPPNNPNDGLTSNLTQFSSGVLQMLSSSSPPHVTSVVVGQDVDMSRNHHNHYHHANNPQRNKLDQAMNELNAEPPYTTIVEPISSSRRDEDDDDDSPHPEEPPYMQISNQYGGGGGGGTATMTTPLPPTLSSSSPHPLTPPLQRASQPLPQRPIERASRRNEESPYTAITNCTSGAMKPETPPPPTTSSASGSSSRAAQHTATATPNISEAAAAAAPNINEAAEAEEDVQSVITVVNSASIDNNSSSDIVTIGRSGVSLFAPSSTSFSSSSLSSGHPTATSAVPKNSASGHVTTIEISGARHTVHGDL